MEKEIHKMWHHKEVITLVFSTIALVLSIVAVSISMDGGEHNKGDWGRDNGDRQERMMGKDANYNDQNRDKNDGEYADDNASSTASTSAIRSVINEVKEKIK